MTTWISHVLQSIATNCCLGKCCGGIFQTAFLPRGAFSLFAPCAFCSIKFRTKENACEIEMLLMTLSEGHYGGCHYHHSYFNNPALNIIGKHFTKLLKSHYVLTFAKNNLQKQFNNHLHSCFTFPKEMCDFSSPLVYTDLTCFPFALSYRGANECLVEQRTGCFSWPIYLFLSLFSVLCSLFRGRILLQDSRLLIMAQHRAWCNYTLLWRFRCCSARLIIVIGVGTFWNGRHIHTEQEWTCLNQKNNEPYLYTASENLFIRKH